MEFQRLPPPGDESRALCVRANPARRWLTRADLFLLFSGLLSIFPLICPAQVNYVARFSMEKRQYLLGEPIFCIFTVQNTGARTLAFSYRSPSRVLNPELEQEPRFAVTDASGHALPDPAPKPCGGAN